MTTCKRTHRMCWGRACSGLTLALTSIASAARRRRTHPSCPLHEATSSPVHPLCGQMKHTRRHRVPEYARSVGEHAGVRRAPCDEDACATLGGAAGRRQKASAVGLWGDGAVSGGRCLGGEGDRSNRSGDDAGAHARHMRRRTQSGLCQLTLHPRPISRVSSASSPSLAACHTALPIESLIASAALIRPSPARTPADSGGHARLRGDAREAAARTPSRCACAARPQAPRSSGGRGGSRGARARRGRSKRPRRAVGAAATPGSRGSKQRGMGVRSSCGSQRSERLRCRPSGSTRAQGARVGSDPRSQRGQRPTLPEAPKARSMSCRRVWKSDPISARVKEKQAIGLDECVQSARARGNGGNHVPPLH
jgi:hypothetical protein